MSRTFSILNADGESFVTVLVSGHDPLVANDSHPAFHRIVKALTETHEDDAHVISLFDVATAAVTEFRRISDRVTTADGRIFFDGDEVANPLTTQIVRFMDSGDNFEPLLKFFEKVQSNPNEHSREQLFDWLDRRDFAITREGDIVAYKGVSSNGDGKYRSINSGTAIVNGIVQRGSIPQENGDIVEMPRSQVAHDPSLGCHTGLHVGTHEYASSFAQGALLEVHVNPRDVVSVPTDCSSQKVRVCRYVVVDTIEDPYSDPLKAEADDRLSDDDCDGCGRSCSYCDCDDEWDELDELDEWEAWCGTHLRPTEHI